jgi:hypothetical protein
MSDERRGGSGWRLGTGGWFLLTLLLAAGSISRAETVTLEPAKDNTLFEDPQGRLSNGAGMHLFAGRVDSRMGEVIRRGLIAFDVGPTIPAGVTITAVTLRLNMSMTIATAQDVSLHRVLADWGEGTSKAASGEGGGAIASQGDATWVHTFFNDRRWANAGGDFAGVSSATIPVAANGVYTWGSTPGMVGDVQSWLDEPQTNFGWMIVGNEAVERTAKRFDSRESRADLRPRLTIDFEQPSPTPTATPTPVPPTATSTPTPTATPTPTITPTHAPLPCVGDCNGDGSVTPAEVVLGVAIGLGQASPAECAALDVDGDDRVEIGELVRAVDSSFGCIPALAP